MRRIQSSLVACCDDLLWSLSDLQQHLSGRRTAHPRAFIAFVALLLGLFIIVPAVTLTPSENTIERPHATQSPTQSSGSAQIASDRYVPYNGLTHASSADQDQQDAAASETVEPEIVVRPLSEVLRADLNEASLLYGSDGAEGGILPLDNGVVPSSGPRFNTSWEVILPSAGIRASVVQVGLTPSGEMGSPDNPFVFGWFNRSAVPGEPGNALLGGHRDYEDVDGNIDVGVGWELDEPRVGEQLIMRNAATNRYYVYDIVETATISPDSPEAIRYLSQTRESVVTLITCAGDFDEETHSYAERIIVVALLSAVAEPDA